LPLSHEGTKFHQTEIFLVKLGAFVLLLHFYFLTFYQVHKTKNAKIPQVTDSGILVKALIAMIAEVGKPHK